MNFLRGLGTVLVAAWTAIALGALAGAGLVAVGFFARLVVALVRVGWEALPIGIF